MCKVYMNYLELDKDDDTLSYHVLTDEFGDYYSASYLSAKAHISSFGVGDWFDLYQLSVL